MLPNCHPTGLELHSSIVSPLLTAESRSFPCGGHPPNAAAAVKALGAQEAHIAAASPLSLMIIMFPKLLHLDHVFQASSSFCVCVGIWVLVLMVLGEFLWLLLLLLLQVWCKDGQP
jgi:hypothetical protein